MLMKLFSQSFVINLAEIIVDNYYVSTETSLFVLNISYKNIF